MQSLGLIVEPINAWAPPFLLPSQSFSLDCHVPNLWVPKDVELIFKL